MIPENEKDHIKETLLDMMKNPPRVITSREVFDSEFVAKWKICLGLAITELGEIGISHKDLDYTMADVLSATAQLFICWNQNNGYIESLKKQKQEAWDKKFEKPIVKNGN